MYLGRNRESFEKNQTKRVDQSDAVIALLTNQMYLLWKQPIRSLHFTVISVWKTVAWKWRLCAVEWLESGQKWVTGERDVYDTGDVRLRHGTWWNRVNSVFAFAWLKREWRWLEGAECNSLSGVEADWSEMELLYDSYDKWWCWWRRELCMKVDLSCFLLCLNCGGFCGFVPVYETVRVFLRLSVLVRIYVWSAAKVTKDAVIVQLNCGWTNGIRFKDLDEMCVILVVPRIVFLCVLLQLISLFQMQSVFCNV